MERRTRSSRAPEVATVKASAERPLEPPDPPMRSDAEVEDVPASPPGTRTSPHESPMRSERRSERRDSQPRKESPKVHVPREEPVSASRGAPSDEATEPARPPRVSVPRRDPHAVPRPTRHVRKKPREHRDAKDDERRVLNLPITKLRRLSIAELDSPRERQEKEEPDEVEEEEERVSEVPDEEEEEPAPKKPEPKRVSRPDAQIFGSDDEVEEEVEPDDDRDAAQTTRDERSVERRRPRVEPEDPPRRHRGEEPRRPSPGPRRPSPGPRRAEPESEDEEDDDDSRFDDEEEEDDFYEEPATEQELQDEYRAMLRRMKRMYRYLEIDIPPPGASSKRLGRLLRYYIDEVSTAEGLEKYRLMLLVGFVILEVLGKKLGLPCDDYAELQRDQIGNYHSMLVEFGDRDYFGFARGWPVEARLLGMMLANMGMLVVGRLLLEKDTMKKLITAVIGSRRTPAIALDQPVSENPDAAVAGGSGAPAGAADALTNIVSGLASGGAGAGGAAGAGNGLGGILSMITSLFAGSGGPPARERSEQGGPSYSRRRRREPRPAREEPAE